MNENEKIIEKPYLVWIENWIKDPNWSKVAAKIHDKVAKRAKTDDILYEDSDRILIESSAPPVRLRGYATISPWALWMTAYGCENTWDAIQNAIAAKRVSEQALGWHGISPQNLAHEAWIGIGQPYGRGSTRRVPAHAFGLARVDLTMWQPLAKHADPFVGAYHRLLHMAKYLDDYAYEGQSLEGWRRRLLETRKDQTMWLMCPWAAPKAKDLIESEIFARARWALQNLRWEEESLPAHLLEK